MFSTSGCSPYWINKDTILYSNQRPSDNKKACCVLDITTGKKMNPSFWNEFTPTSTSSIAATTSPDEKLILLLCYPYVYLIENSKRPKILKQRETRASSVGEFSENGLVVQPEAVEKYRVSCTTTFSVWDVSVTNRVLVERFTHLLYNPLRFLPPSYQPDEAQVIYCFQADRSQPSIDFFDLIARNPAFKKTIFFSSWIELFFFRKNNQTNPYRQSRIEHRNSFHFKKPSHDKRHEKQFLQNQYKKSSLNGIHRTWRRPKNPPWERNTTHESHKISRNYRELHHRRVQCYSLSLRLGWVSHF